MARILFINPNRWGRGITTMWIPSHAAVLKAEGHNVRLFDCTFYRCWSQNETKFNTENWQFKPTDYESQIKWNDNDIYDDFSKAVKEFNPDIIFWSAFSSHIHGEGEYSNIQHGHDLIKRSGECQNAIKIAGGLQPTASPETMYSRFPEVDYFIRGESELVLLDLVVALGDPARFKKTPGLVFQEKGNLVMNDPQPTLDMSKLPLYDYSIFEDQVFLRPYRGQVVRCADYELSRGCVFTCSYCVETVIQKYYGFETNSKGVLVNAKDYLRHKTARQVIGEITTFYEQHKVTFIRCHDTNFLTINRDFLQEVASFLDKGDLPINLYIETRPEGINSHTVELLKRLRVVGVAMGIELAADRLYFDNLNRFTSTDRTVKAFKLLKDAGIGRTAYNVIGFPNQTEKMIIDTIELNRRLDPDTIVVAFFSPFLGTGQQAKGASTKEYREVEENLDSQLLTMSRSRSLKKSTLEFYMKYFNPLVKEGLDKMEEYKSDFFEKPESEAVSGRDK